MEVWVVLLVAIFVVVHTKLVVEHRVVLPLNMRLDGQELHEVVDFDFGELAAKLFLTSKDTSVLATRLNDVLVRPLTGRLAWRLLLFAVLFSVFVTGFFLAVLAVTFLFVFIFFLLLRLSTLGIE